MTDTPRIVKTPPPQPRPRTGRYKDACWKVGTPADGAYAPFAHCTKTRGHEKTGRTAAARRHTWQQKETQL